MKVWKSCSIEGCNKRFYAIKYCQPHYRRLKCHGDIDICKHETVCSVDGCDRIDIMALGFCTMHYARFYKYGDTGTADPLHIRNIEYCVVDKCKAKPSAYDMCYFHYLKLPENDETEQTKRDSSVCSA